MLAPQVRADYAALHNVSQVFSQQAEATGQSLRQLKEHVAALRGGDWIGKGATAFYGEMHEQVLPAVQRLQAALSAGADVTRQIHQLMQAAEEEAARILHASGGAGLAPAAAASAMLGFPGTAAAPASGGGAAGLASAAADAAAAMPSVEAVLRELAKGEAAMDHALTTAGTVLVLLGIVPAKGAPADIELPGVLNHGIKAAWDKSFPQGIEQEQGGILVITKAGTLEWRSGKPKGEAGQGEYSFTPNHQDIRGAEYVGFGHTHPYSNSAENSGPSAQDISLLFVNDRAGRWPPERMILVQSGNDQYLVARTAEFDQIVKPRDTGERTALAVGMERMYHRVMKQQQQAGATKAEQVDAAIKAVAQYYDLVYYKGTNGHLIKQ